MALPITTIIGNISYTESKVSNSGNPILSFNIEASEKDKDGKWLNLSIKTAVFGKTAEFMSQHFKDGDIIVATGKLITESWTTQANEKRNAIKLLFPSVSYPPKVKQQQNAPQGNSGGQYNQQNNSNGYGNASYNNR